MSLTTWMKPVLSFVEAVRAKFVRVEHYLDELHRYQRTAIQFLIDNPFSALFIDCGMGKTVISLTAILRLCQSFEANKILIIAPVRVANETWPTEIELWNHTAALTCCHIRDEDVIDRVNAAGDKARREVMAAWREEARLWQLNKVETKAFLAEANKSEATKQAVAKARLNASRVAVREHFKRSKATIHIINREQVEFLVGAWGRDWPYDAVFIDESSAFKDHTTKRFKALKRVRPLMKRLHELTATPAAETYLHLFAQVYLMDQGERLGRSITRYREQYFTHNEYTRQYKLKPGADEEITAKIADICLVMKAEDYLPRMEPHFIVDKIVLTAQEQNLYDTMERDFVVQLPTGEIIEAETAAAKSQKLVQMASGVLYENLQILDEFGEVKKHRIVHRLHDHKIEKLQQIVEDCQGETILVAYFLKSSLARLKEAFPHAVVMDKEGKCIKAWTAGKIKILLFSPQSAAHGLNLQYGGRRLVFFDIPWSLELYYQAWRRLARQGQKFVVMVHNLVVQGSIDEDIVECLTDKDVTQEKFFQLLRQFRKMLRNATKRLQVN